MQTLVPTGVLTGLTPEDFDRLIELGTILHYSQGEVVIRENSGGREWYIVLEGKLQVDIDPASLGVLAPGSSDPRAILTLGPGDGFGELALIDAAPRSATVTALEAPTHLLVISPQAFDALVATSPVIASVVLRNLTRDLATKLRRSRLLLLQQLLISHHIRALREELDADCARVDPLLPLHKTLVIRDPDAFVLKGISPFQAAQPSKEIVDVLVFATSEDLHMLLNYGDPSGEVILHGLFSLIRHGRLPEHAAHEKLSYRYAPEHRRRTGTLFVAREGRDIPFRLDWMIKGWHVAPDTGAARASLFLTITSDPAATPASHAQALVTGTAMPIQREIAAQLEQAGVSGAGYRVLAVHHRTHEVAHTLQMLRQLNFQIDSFVGIPYGEASWGTSLMLDCASGHRYLSLQASAHPVEPTRYGFDSYHSSFLADDIEREIAQLYTSPANTGSYRAAMSALLTYLLERALRACHEHGERLLLYEDGAYLTPMVYAIYHDPAHPLHQLVRTAVDSKLLVGSVEVTTSGERAQAAVIRAHNGRALLPVISGARDDVKLIFEAVGVAEAVIQAASTALGNLGLPTFVFRRIAVLGGNGAIGVRLVEQFARIQGGVGHIFAVDPMAAPFAHAIPVHDVPAITARLRYQPIPRYPISERCLPLSLSAKEINAPATIAGHILKALDGSARYDEVVVRDGATLPEAVADAIYEQIACRGGFDIACRERLFDGAGERVVLCRGGFLCRITMLPPGTLLVFGSLRPLLRAGIDTVIGVTGISAFTDDDLDAFLERPVTGACDDLVLISGSSKDYEFHRVLSRLNKCQAASHENNVAPWTLGGFRVRKSIHPDVGSIYHLSRDGVQKRLILLADGFVVNFFARYEKGVKTEYMDPIMTMQMLGLARVATGERGLAPGLHQACEVLQQEYMHAFWRTLNSRCAPPTFVDN